MKKIYSACLLMLALLFSSQSHAGIPVFFGESDELYVIENGPSITEGRETFHLGHRVYKKWFIFGINVVDEGYVLISANNANRYVPLNAGLINDFQEDGSLPKELPSYSIPLMDYLTGYSLWIVLLVLAVLGLKSILSKKPDEE